MARVELAPEVADDFDRIFDYFATHDPKGARERVLEIIESISVLETSPMIGRPSRDDMRELIIGRPSAGYIALYRYVSEVDTVFVLALRSQRESGFMRP